MARTRSICRLALLALLGLAAPARAHQQSATFGEVTRGAGAGGGPASPDAGTIVWRLRVRAVDLARALKAAPAPVAAPAPDLALANRRRAAYLQAGLLVNADDRPCVAGVPSLVLDPSDVELEPTFVFVERFACPGDWTALRLRYDLFFEADRFHESFTRLSLADPAATTKDRESLSTIVFRDGLREVSLAVGDGPSIWRSALVYLRLGIFHILTGYDHLSFLMALLLGAALCRRTTAKTTATAASNRQALKGTVAVISAFTVAHSMTLMVQVLRPGWLPTRWVEPAIAFSVAYVGFENLIPRPPRRRWLLVFGFGLVHGLGFASVLREIGLPRRGLVLSLVSFNLGVEIGQLLVLALTFPLIVGAARRNPRRFERWGLILGSGIIAAFGTVWLIARLAAR